MSLLEKPLWSVKWKIRGKVPTIGIDAIFSDTKQDAIEVCRLNHPGATILSAKQVKKK